MSVSHPSLSFDADGQYITASFVEVSLIAVFQLPIRQRFIVTVKTFWNIRKV